MAKEFDLKIISIKTLLHTVWDTESLVRKEVAVKKCQPNGRF